MDATLTRFLRSPRAQPFTYPSDTVPMNLWPVAVVKYALVSMGMGLAFTEIKPEHQAILQKWISELSGERVTEPEPVVTCP